MSNKTNLDNQHQPIVPSNETEANKPAVTRRDFMKIAGAAGMVVAGAGIPALAQKSKPSLAPPIISCGTATELSINLQVCAGASGAPAGFSIQWMTCDEYNDHLIDPLGDPNDLNNHASGWYPSSDPRLCKASFSGNAKDSRYVLSAGQCITVNVGELLFDNGTSTNCDKALECGTCYVFHSFAHATSSSNKSNFTENLQCSTAACAPTCPTAPNCTYTQGYWKTHGPVGCATGNNSNEWPVTGLTLGTVYYTDLELCSIFNKPAAGNGLITLAHQLIAAKLNVAKGADVPADVADCITTADALIGNLVIPPVGSGSLSNAATSGLVTCLTEYNEGAKGPGHCC